MTTALAGALAEWLFAALPLVVVVVVMANLSRLDELFQSPEWAFGAAVLAGQALLRYIAGFARFRAAPLPRIMFGAAILLVIAAVPAYIVLALVVSKELTDHHLPSLLSVFQALLFIASSLAYVLVSVAASLHEYTSLNAEGGVQISRIRTHEARGGDA